MNDIDTIKARLVTEDPTEFSMQVQALFEWLQTTRDSWRNQHCAEALIKVACSSERNLNIRLLAIEALYKVGHKVPEELRGLISICRNEKEPLRIRWAAIDALKTMNPEIAKPLLTSSAGRDLSDRTIDPDNPLPKLIVQEELTKIAEKQYKELNYYPLIALLIVGGIMGIIWSYNTPYFSLIIISCTTFIVSFIAICMIRVRRCPKCKRFFARVKRERVHAYEGPSMLGGSIGHPSLNRQRVNVYEVRCRYCQHPWVILR